MKIYEDEYDSLFDSYCTLLEQVDTIDSELFETPYSNVSKRRLLEAAYDRASNELNQLHELLYRD